jgi:hypothetical protein
LESDENGTVQVSYALNVIGGEGPVWNSGTVKNAESVLIEYAGLLLRPRTLYQIMLEVTDNHGNKANASGSFETGLMQREITVANGWFSGELGFVMTPNHYGSRTALWAQIEVVFDNGETESIVTDGAWDI